MKQASKEAEEPIVDIELLNKTTKANEWNALYHSLPLLEAALTVVFMSCTDLSGTDYLSLVLACKHTRKFADGAEKLWHCFVWRDWLSPPTTAVIPSSSNSLSPTTLSPSHSPSASPKKERQSRRPYDGPALTQLFPCPENNLKSLSSSLSSLHLPSEPMKYQKVYFSLSRQFYMEKKLEKRQLCNVQYYCKQRQSPLHYQKYSHHCMDAAQCTDFSLEHRKYFIHNTECVLRQFCHFRSDRKFHEEYSLHPCEQGTNCPSRSSWIHNLYFCHK